MLHGRSIVNQETTLEIKNKNHLFNTSEVIPYVNSFCHLIENYFTRKDILSGIGTWIKIKSANNNLTKDEFMDKCKDTYFYKQLKNLNLNEPTCLFYILTCIFENKHISLIKSHVNHYFNN